MNPKDSAAVQEAGKEPGRASGDMPASAADLLRLCDEIEALKAKATPGPWACGFKQITNHSSFAYFIAPSDDSSECVSMGSNRTSGIDQRFIQRLHNAADTLLAAARQNVRRGKLLEQVSNATTRIWHPLGAEARQLREDIAKELP